MCEKPKVCVCYTSLALRLKGDVTCRRSAAVEDYRVSQPAQLHWERKLNNSTSVLVVKGLEKVYT